MRTSGSRAELQIAKNTQGEITINGKTEAQLAKDTVDAGGNFKGEVNQLLAARDKTVQPSQFADMTKKVQEMFAVSTPMDFIKKMKNYVRDAEGKLAKFYHHRTDLHIENNMVGYYDKGTFHALAETPKVLQKKITIFNEYIAKAQQKLEQGKLQGG